jgi:hypothetical protein
MTQQKNEAAEYDFTEGLAQPAIRVLVGPGCTRLEQLATATEANLQKLHGMGPKATGLLRSALNDRGQSFADPE